MHSHAHVLLVFTILFSAPSHIFYFYLLQHTEIAVEIVSLFHYSLFYFVHAETLKAKNAAHIHKRDTRTFAVFLLRPSFLQVFKVKYSKHFFSESVAVRSSMCLNFSWIVLCTEIFFSIKSFLPVRCWRRKSKQ